MRLATTPAPCLLRFASRCAGARGLEVGGPSAVFGADGLLPIYPILDAVDGVQWATHTMWHDLDREGGYRPEHERRGELYVVDGADLGVLPKQAYDVVMCSHVLEHIANPLRALASWRDATRPGGHLLMVVPHMAGTFDRRRPLTGLRHIVEDFESGIDEDDLTHLEETLRLHDRGGNTEPGDRETWEARRRENHSTRVLHHHTFTTPSLIALLDHAGLELLAVQTRFPHDIYVLGRWPDGGCNPDNTLFLSRWTPSPFKVDRLRDRASSDA